jgi:hypothetical protein
MVSDSLSTFAQQKETAMKFFKAAYPDPPTIPVVGSVLSANYDHQAKPDAIVSPQAAYQICSGVEVGHSGNADLGVPTLHDGRHQRWLNTSYCDGFVA